MGTLCLRRLRSFYQSPGCRQGTILARLRHADGCPAAVAPGHHTFCFVRRPVGRRERLAQSERANDTCARTGRRDGAAGARPCGSRRSRRSRPTTPVTAGHGGHCGHGRPRLNVRTRGHGPGVTNQARTGRVRVRTAPSGHDLSTAVTAVVTAAAAPPGSQPGAPGAAPTRSSAKWRVNGEPGLRGGDRRWGGNYQGRRAGGSNKTNAITCFLGISTRHRVNFLVE